LQQKNSDERSEGMERKQSALMDNCTGLDQSSTIRFATGKCSLGFILAARSEKGLCAILLGDDREALECELRARFSKAALIPDADLKVLAKAIAFAEAPASGLDLMLDMRGTAFQQKVWRALQEIPAGATESYSSIARRIGAPKAARAVAQACAANSIAIAIPCHRAVRNDGALSGYRCGIARKRALLEKERVLAHSSNDSALTFPKII
jgi:AraC family transcriptional regulator of adaptative response/methylated-DNA-[protein]-cysteine methyltransferase